MNTKLLLLLLLPYHALSARILAVVPTPSISHHLPFHVLLRELAARGHNITYITPNPMQDAPENITQIDVSLIYEIIGDWHKYVDKEKNSSFAIFEKAVELAESISDKQLECPMVQELIQSGETFDLFILEMVGYQAYYGLLHKVGSPPLMGYTSVGMTEARYGTVGNPNFPSYMPIIVSEFTDHMMFWQRTLNAAASYLLSFLLDYYWKPVQENIMRKHFGPEPPSIFETEYNYSLILSATNFVSGYPAPRVPNVVEVTGLHIKKSPDPLPKDIKEFLDGAENGAIYFSLGSNVKSKDLSEDLRRAILEAFSELPQRVLWKFEADSLPGQPDNVMVAKWLPQQDVLAHPNVRVFITQGGLQSFNEASYYAVPLIGIPILGDQEFNVAKMVATGIGIHINKPDISKETVKEAVGKLLTDASYRENMQRYSAMYREHQAESLDKAVWWVEYVIRHNGAPHLRSAALDLRWWQLLLLDVAAFVIAVAAVAGYCVYVICRKVADLLKLRVKESKTE